ncbi:MAG: hypothetical protein PUP93_32110 [Rhizonema sp. NSF051]|nr:hypothetical protein [Rhizonema sp. NSF051]
MEILQIKSLREIDELVALKLGWIESSYECECSQFTVGAQWNYGSETYTIEIKHLFPREIVEAGEEEEWADAHLHWYEKNGGTTQFSSYWDDTELLLKECDRCGLIIELTRDNKITSCSIKRGSKTVKSTTHTGSPYNIPQSGCLPLAISIAWLLWHDIEIEFSNTLEYAS